MFSLAFFNPDLCHCRKKFISTYYDLHCLFQNGCSLYFIQRICSKVPSIPDVGLSRELWSFECCNDYDECHQLHVSCYRHDSVLFTALNVGFVTCRAYFVRFQRSPAGSDLAAIQAHRTAIDPASTLLDIDTIGEITQFLSTLLLLQGTSGITEDDKKALSSKMKKWENMYRGTGRVAENASERCNALLTSKSYVFFNASDCNLN
jgi:hypothetical protein